jgi:hypothetical protein
MTAASESTRVHPGKRANCNQNDSFRWCCAHEEARFRCVVPQEAS